MVTLVTAAAGLSAGMIVPFSGPTGNIPVGFLLCDGSVINRNTYSDLFAEIGTAWGSGDGSTTFAIPPCEGVGLRGVANGSALDPDRASRVVTGSGGNTGDNVGTYQADEFKSHTHSIAAYFGSVVTAGHPHVGDQSFHSNFNTGAAGGNETRNKNVYVHYIIKY